MRSIGLTLLVTLLWLPPILLGSDDAPPRSATKAQAEQLIKGIAYRNEPDQTEYSREKCQLDLYLPAKESGFATIIFFHGGGLTGGERSIPEALKGKGIAIAGAGYRLHPHVTAPVYIEDAAAAVAWVMKNIEKHGGSPKRVFVSGHSAGGYLSLMVGLDQRWLKKHNLDSNQLAGLAPLSGQTITHFTIRKERQIPDTQPTIDEFAPLYHVRKDAPPTLLITGDREKEILGRYEENAYLWRMLQVVKHPDTKLIELPGFDHGGMAVPAFPHLVEFVKQKSQ